MSQDVTIAPVVMAVQTLIEAVSDIGAEIQQRRQLKTGTKTTCEVDYVVVDKTGAEVGVRVNPKTKEAELLSADGPKGKGAKLAGQLMQRYAYLRTTEELRKKGYKITKEEKQTDGTVRVVLAKWQ